MKTTIIIPSYKPTDKIIKLVNQLYDNDLRKIIVVDDGSDSELLKHYEPIMEKIELLKHDVNMGKGAAIKTAIKSLKDTDSFITVDADLQHSVKDVLRVKDVLEKHDIVIGKRNFRSKNVPIRSRIGNRISSVIFFFQTFRICMDTQTGLRGINIKYKDLCLNTEGNRFEYEMNFLRTIYRKRLDICMIDIDTIYLDKNKGSHFHAFRDSFLIHGRFVFICILIIILLLILYIQFH